MIYKPDFEKAYIKATEFLIQIADHDFPFNLRKLFAEFTDFKLISFDQLREQGCDQKLFGSEDAFILEDPLGFIYLCYNTKSPVERKRFSFAHELGHHCLGHNTDSSLMISDRNLYDKQELEANYFAAQLLMPEQIFSTLKDKGVQLNVTDIATYFKVSKEAAQKRLQTLNKRNSFKLSNEQKMWDEVISFGYRNFIKSITSKHYHEKTWYDDEAMEQERQRWIANGW